MPLKKAKSVCVVSANTLQQVEKCVGVVFPSDGRQSKEIVGLERETQYCDAWSHSGHKTESLKLRKDFSFKIVFCSDPHLYGHEPWATWPKECYLNCKRRTSEFAKSLKPTEIAKNRELLRSARASAPATLPRGKVAYGEISPFQISALFSVNTWPA